MSANKDTGAESFRALVPDFDEWPESWMGVEEDLAYGQKLLPWFAGFLQALYDEGLSRNSIFTSNTQLSKVWIARAEPDTFVEDFSQ